MILHEHQRRVVGETYYQRNRERILIRVKENYYANREKKIAYTKKYASLNKEKVLVWHKTHRDKEETKKKRREWIAKNQIHINKRIAKR